MSQQIITTSPPVTLPAGRDIINANFTELYTAVTSPRAANLVWCGPATGSAAAPTFRQLVPNDIAGALNATATGQAFIGLTPSQGSGSVFPSINAGTLTVSTLTAADFRAAIGAFDGDATNLTNTIDGASSTLKAGDGSGALNWAGRLMYSNVAALLDWTGTFNAGAAYSFDGQILKGSGAGLTALDPSNLAGSTTAGQSFITLTNPGAIAFPRINADSSVDALSASDFRTAIGAGTSSFDGVYDSLSGKPDLTLLAPLASPTFTGTVGVTRLDAVTLLVVNGSTYLDASGLHLAGTSALVRDGGTGALTIATNADAIILSPASGIVKVTSTSGALQLISPDGTAYNATIANGGTWAITPA